MLSRCQKSSQIRRQVLFTIYLPFLLLVGLCATLPAMGQTSLNTQDGNGQAAQVPGTMIFTGAATYSIPVGVLPGRNNLAPDLTLSYNSFSGNGWLGLGWSLGMPAIQRATKRGLDYSADDFLAGSDELTRRTDWGSGYYGLKIENSFSKYYYDGTSWEVTAKNGMRFFYGQTAESRQGKDSANTFIWLLSRVEDTNGNYFTLSYLEDQGQLYLSTINYTGHNSGLLPSNRVEFELENRPDPLTSYASGKKITTAKRLKAIRVYNKDNNLSSAFQLSYDTNSPLDLSRLIRVQRLGSDNTSFLPPIDIEWNGQNQVSFAGATTTNSPGSSDAGYLRFADINGDGKDDMVTHNSSGTVYTQLGNGDGTFGSSHTTNGSGGEGPGYVTLADLNADGMADLIKHDQNGNVYFAFSQGDGTFGSFTTHTGPGGEGQWRVGIVDINGDGAGDLIKSETSGSTEKLYIYTFDASANTFSSSYTQPGGPGGGIGKEFIIDINHDSYADLLKCDDNEKLYIFTSNKSDGFNTSYTTFTASGLKKGYVRFGDVNGDSVPDLVIHKDDGTVNVYLADGLGSFSTTAVSHTGQGGDDANRIQVRDLNADGFADLIKEDSSGKIYIYLSIPGNGAFQSTPVYSQTKPNSNMREGIMFNDVNGDGRPDLVRPDDTGTAYCYQAQGFGTPGLMKKARVENGASITMDYTLSTNFTHTLMPGKMFLVNTRTVEDGFGNLSTESYQYADGLFDYADREFRGFGFVTRINPDNTILKTWFHQTRKLKGTSYQEEFWDAGETAIISRTTNTYEIPEIGPQGQGIVFAKHTRTRTEKYDDQTVFTQKDIVYDNETGNPLTTTLSGTGAESLITEMTHDIYGGADGWIWRKTRETLSGSESGKVREQYFTYDTLTGNLSSKSAWLEGGINPETTYGYDIYGNQTSVTNARGFTSTKAYDIDTYTFPVRASNPQTNGIILSVETTYNPLYAKPDTVTDENGNITHYTYDVFGRETQVLNPDGGIKLTEYYDFLVPRKQVVKVKENETSAPETVSFAYVDGLGRPIQSVTQGESQYIIVKKHYDNMGREYLSQGPFFSNTYDCPQPLPASYPYIKTYFDARSRPIMVETAGETADAPIISSMIYSGFNATAIDPDNARKEEVKDYLGRLIEVRQYTDLEVLTTRYQYNAAKDLLLLTNPYGNETLINYDTLGQKIAMDDPDMGHWEYIYDANGNLLSQTDAQGQVIRFTYDNLDRLLKKECFNDSLSATPIDGETISYVYDNTAIANGKGQVYTVTRGNVQTVYDTYDVMGRETVVSKMINGQRYTTSKVYDLSGRVIKIIYPDLYEVHYTYHPGSGLLKETLGKSQDQTETASLAHFDQYEATGKMGQVYYGNDTFTTFSYNQATARLTGIQTLDFQGLHLQNLNYDYTKGGDISKISDIQNNITREYTYDRLHRLTAEHISNNGVPINNIDALAYSHDNPDHIHAVSAINYNGIDAQYIYDANGNMTASPDLKEQDHIQRTITYDTDNMPVQIVKGNTTVAFTYDGHGTRVEKKINDSIVTTYAGEHFEIENGIQTKYIFAGNLRIAMIQNNETFFLHKDHLGSSTVLTDSSGTIRDTQQASYMPFGMTRGDTDITLTDYKYTGQEFDGETGLYNYNARLYDPVIGMFISADIMVPDPTNPQTMNRYAYCYNNPLVYTDPSGHWGFLAPFIPFIKAVFWGAAIGGAVSEATGGDFWDGALSGAISGALFYGAGSGLFGADKLISHTIAGGMSGGINAAINGGDIGKGILTGAIAGGLAEFAGGYIPDNTPAQLAGRSLVGGFTGGITSEIYGGSFSDGFMSGMQTAAYGYLFNHMSHEGYKAWQKYNSIYFDNKFVTFQGEKYAAESGPWGNGKLPEGNYLGDNLRIRTHTAMIDPDGFGWSLDLSPQFQTDRTLLRIHPDGNTPGTLGCIGVQADARLLYDRLKNFLQSRDSVRVKVQY